MDNKHKEQLIKFLLIGESAVGKTCIILRYTDKEFYGNHISTVGIEFKKKTVTYENEKVVLQIWDTAGQDRFNVLTKKFCKNSHVIIIVYDITQRTTFEKVTEWMRNIEENANKNVQVVLVGNKCDLEDKRVVTYQEGKDLADKNLIAFFEASAMNDVNITQIFEHHISVLMEKGREDSKKKVENKYVKTRKFCG